MVRFIEKINLSKDERNSVLNLWNDEYPKRLNYHSLLEFESYLDTLADPFHLLMKVDNQYIKGWYFDFIRKNNRWFGLIIDSSYQGKGFGTKMLDLAKEKRSQLNGWVIEKDDYKKRYGEYYKSPLFFYLKNGFVKSPEERMENEKLSAIKVIWTE